MAPGVDNTGWAWAYVNGVPIREFYADWNDTARGIKKRNKYGRQYNPMAGFERNERMGSYAEALIAITNGSSGTKHMIDTAEDRGLKVYVERV